MEHLWRSTCGLWPTGSSAAPSTRPRSHESLSRSRRAASGPSAHRRWKTRASSGRRGRGATPSLRQTAGGVSSGCRPGRTPYDALAAGTGGSETRHVNWGLEADRRGFFETLAQAWLGKCVAHRLGARRVVQPLRKWLKAGVREEGQWPAQAAGTSHGGSVRPVAAHRSLHDVLDLWADRGRRQHARGGVSIVRSGDDCRVGFAHRDAAERFWRALRERCQQCNRALPPEQTRLIAWAALRPTGGRGAVRASRRRLPASASRL